ncbi:hypothetical protein D3C71_1893760 [compost metagenome]
MFGAEIEHLLGLRDATNHRSSQGATFHDQVEHVGRWMRRGRRSHQGHRAVPLEQYQQGVQVVRGGNCVDDQVEAFQVRGHLLRIA